MPDPISAGALAAISGGTSLLNAGITSTMNAATRKWNEKMYALQRQHALQDWEMQNAYNSPQAQMERLKAAGLNPNLVYGQGAVANASQGVRSTDAKSWNPQIPQINENFLNSALGVYQNIKLKDAQADLARQAIDNQMQQKLKMVAETNNIMARTAMTDFQRQMAIKNSDTTFLINQQRLDYLKQQTQQSAAQTQLSLTNNQRAQLMMAPNYLQGYMNILQTELRNEQIKAQTLESRARSSMISASEKKILVDTLEKSYKQIERLNAEISGKNLTNEEKKWRVDVLGKQSQRMDRGSDRSVGPFGVISYIEEKLNQLRQGNY